MIAVAELFINAVTYIIFITGVNIHNRPISIERM